MGFEAMERPARLRVVLEALEAQCFSMLAREEAPRATREQLMRVHPASYVDTILATRPEGDGHVVIDGDTAMGSGSAEAALHAAGAGIAAVDAVMRGEFAREVHGAGRVAILDFDVHHGNGTQAVFERDPSVFFASSHQMPLYPGTGAASERGMGNILNVALPPGAKGDEFRAAWSERILPAVEGFSPGLILVSAGFDAHARDPLAHLRLTEADFAWVTGEICAVARRVCGGRVVSMLEGGYDLDALARSVAAHVRALMDA